ncbi:DUF1697 domain-containing protein [Yoonia sp. 208BN28-4]|uniref:DUF1697 domain-containing protein n=1 Tax=Yoonia sp. 208BN28-4 TaxID=3126505 RepID=UPI0030B131D9
MAKWVALLRGVNVGGKNNVPMERLRAACTGAGLTGLQTYIQSGNLVFDSDKTADALAQVLHGVLTSEFDLTIPILVLPDHVFQKMLAACPFPESRGNLAHGYFCFSEPGFDEQAYESLKTLSEEVQIKGTVVWLHAPDGIAGSKLAARFESVITDTILTGRNLNTIRKIAEMLDG